MKLIYLAVTSRLLRRIVSCGGHPIATRRPRGPRPRTRKSGAGSRHPGRLQRQDGAPASHPPVYKCGYPGGAERTSESLL